MIMRRMNITGLLVLFTLIPFHIPDLSAQTQMQLRERETLRGLKGFSVLIEEPKDVIKQAGLTRLTQSILRTDVELKLRKAGIRVLTEDEMYLTPGMPHLLITVAVIKSHGFVYYWVGVFFKQDVILSRNRSIETSAVIWKESILWVTPDLRHLRHIRDEVASLVDMFMNDYLAVNPK